MNKLLALGLIAPAAGGLTRLLGGLYDQSKQDPTAPVPTSIVPIPINKKRLKWAQAVPFAKEDALSPLGSPFYRSSSAEPKSWGAGHFADSHWGLPWYAPGAAALTLGGAYGGYKLVDSLMNKQRKNDLKSEVDDARNSLNSELQRDAKSASVGAAAPLVKLAALRCAALFEKAAQDTQPVPPALQPTTPEPAPSAWPSFANVGGFATGAGAAALAALAGYGGLKGYEHAQLNDPARIAKERAKRQIANQWAVAPPEVIAVPQG